MPKLVVRLFAALLAATPLCAARLEAQGFTIIVNESNPVSALSRSQLSDVFLKRVKLDGRVPTIPVDLREGSPVREEFSMTIHRKPVRAIAAYWRSQVFSGGPVPPSAKATDDEVLAYVRRTPGAIGYVSIFTDIPAGVKVLAVGEGE